MAGAQMEYTRKVVACKRCGKMGLVWCQNKAGKFYLVETSYPAIRVDGDVEVGYGYTKVNYHKCGECAAPAPVVEVAPMDDGRESVAKMLRAGAVLRTVTDDGAFVAKADGSGVRFTDEASGYVMPVVSYTTALDNMKVFCNGDWSAWAAA